MWTPEEEVELRQLWGTTLLVTEIAELLGRKRVTTSNKASRMGLPPKKLSNEFMRDLRRKSYVSQQLTTVRLKNEFIEAVSRHHKLTHNGVVNRKTYQAWSKSDPQFFEWLKAFRKRERLVKKFPKPKPARIEPGELLASKLREVDLYEAVRKAVGDAKPVDVRDNAISIGVLAVLEGVVSLDALDGASFLREARKEFSHRSLDAMQDWQREKLMNR